MRQLRLSILIAVGVAIASCADMGNGPDPHQPEPPGPQISFSVSIKPTLQTYCSGCHGGLGGFFVTSVDSLKTTGDHKPNAIPGDGAGSNIVKKLSAGPPFGVQMPYGGPYMSAEFIDTLRMWIDQGAKDN